VQLGQQVQAGAALLAVVPVQEMHVDANFKEVQLAQVRVGQPVTVHSDLYGRSVTYHGIVGGLSGGSGSAFATIPAQNATGNGVNGGQAGAGPIVPGPAGAPRPPPEGRLSMTATIDTRAPRH